MPENQHTLASAIGDEWKAIQLNPAEEKQHNKLISLLDSKTFLIGEENIRDTILNGSYPLKPTLFICPALNFRYLIGEDMPECRHERVDKSRTRSIPTAHAKQIEVTQGNGGRTSMHRETFVKQMLMSLKGNPKKETTYACLMLNLTFQEDIYLLTRALTSFRETDVIDQAVFTNGRVLVQGVEEHCLLSADHQRAALKTWKTTIVFSNLADFVNFTLLKNQFKLNLFDPFDL